MNSDEYSKLSIYNINFNNDIPFEEFNEFKCRIYSLLKKSIYNIRINNGDENVYSFIE